VVHLSGWIDSATSCKIEFYLKKTVFDEVLKFPKNMIILF